MSAAAPTRLATRNRSVRAAFRTRLLLFLLRLAHRVQRMLQRLARLSLRPAAIRAGMAPATRARRADAETLPAVERRLLSTCSAAAAAAGAAQAATAATAAATATPPDVRADHPAIAPRRAAVLVALFEGDDEEEEGGGGKARRATTTNAAANAAAAGPARPPPAVRVWLTRRADTLSSHAGEVCLPGGKRDPEDASDAACALREAEEELGLPRGQARVLCSLPPLLSKHRLSVHPVVAVVPRSFAPRINPGEVAEAFSMPLGAFLEARGHLHWDFEGDAAGGGREKGAAAAARGGGGGGDGKKRPRGGGDDGGSGNSTPGPKLRMHSFAYKSHVVWGLTAEVLVRVARLGLGREAEFPLAAPAGGTDFSRLWCADGKVARADRVGGGGWDRLLLPGGGGGGGGSSGAGRSSATSGGG